MPKKDAIPLRLLLSLVLLCAVLIGVVLSTLDIASGMTVASLSGLLLLFVGPADAWSEYRERNTPRGRATAAARALVEQSADVTGASRPRLRADELSRFVFLVHYSPKRFIRYPAAYKLIRVTKPDCVPSALGPAEYEQYRIYSK